MYCLRKLEIVSAAGPFATDATTEQLIACLSCTPVSCELVRFLWILCVCAAEDSLQDLCYRVLNQLQVYTAVEVIHSSLGAHKS